MSYLITFLLFFLPFFILPFGVSPFETPKVILAQVGIILLIALFFSRFNLKPEHLRKLLLLSPFFLLILYSSLFTHSDTVFFGNAFRMQGVFLFLLLLMFSWIASQIPHKRLPIWTVTALLAVQLMAALLILGQEDGRSIGTLGEANALAAFAVFVWPFLLFRAHDSDGKKSFLIGIGIVLTLFVILASGSRSGIIAFSLQLLFLFLYRFGNMLAIKAVVICLIFLAGSFALPFLEQGKTYEKRSEVWVTAAVAGLKEPVLGHGIGNTAQAISETVDETKNYLGGIYIDSSHNIFLDYWVQMGALGVLALSYLLYRSFLMFLRQKSYRGILLLIGMLTVLSFNPASIVGLIHFWWIIGQGLTSKSE